MTESIILHHYENSPYAEKIRLMFGLTNSHWQSLLSPAMPPRPNIDPLTGGYRRIPVAQIGADIFCDTSLIAKEVARITQSRSLDLSLIDEETLALMQQAEEEVFFAAIAAIPPLRILGTMLRFFGPIGMYRFAKDRSGLLNGSSRAPNNSNATIILSTFLDMLDDKLNDSAWINGEMPSIADFAAFHPLWLHVSCNRRPLAASASVQQWYQRVENIGHGERIEITQADGFKTARDAEPRPLPSEQTISPVALGETVQVAPTDYGVVPATGILAAVTESRIIIARDTDECGTVHVHFPNKDYSLSVR